MADSDFIVVKVGGSLYDLPALRPKLLSLFERQVTKHMAIFPGGGRLAEAIRELDRFHQLGEERSHWLAVQCLSVAARFLVELLEPRGTCVASLPALQQAWASNLVGIIDPLAFAQADARSAAPLPHSWNVTSDSLALRLAQQWGANRLILLKSTTPSMGWLEDEANEVVDRQFRKLWLEGARPMEVTIENLRATVS